MCIYVDPNLPIHPTLFPLIVSICLFSTPASISAEFLNVLIQFQLSQILTYSESETRSTCLHFYSLGNTDLEVPGYIYSIGFLILAPLDAHPQ